MLYINGCKKYKRNRIERQVIMNEINKSDVKITQSMARNIKPEVKTEKGAPQVDNVDYKEAAAAPGAEAAGRAMVRMNKADNIEKDIQKIIDNPKLADDSDVLFNAAEKAGVPYPVATSFATAELSK